MPTNRLVEREKIATYASVLLDEARKAGGQDAVLEIRDQAEQLVGFARENMALSGALEDVGYSPEQRSSLVREVFGGYHVVLVEVIAVMAARGDAELLWRVLKSYEEQIQEKLDIVVVDVTTVVPLDARLRTLIKEKAETDLGANVVLREHIDAALLGGIVMSAQGKRIDASVFSQMESARSVLKLSTDGGECS